MFTGFAGLEHDLLRSEDVNHCLGIITGSVRGGKIRTVLRFAVVAQVRFYTKRGPGTSYRFLDIGTLRDMPIGLFQGADPRKLRRNHVAVARD